MALCCLLLMGVGCHRYAAPEEHIVCAVSEACEGHHTIGGKRYNFEADLMDSLARRTNRTATTLTALPTDSIILGLRSGNADVAVVPARLREELHNFPSHPLYATRYVIVTRSSVAPAEADELCQGRKVGCSVGFSLAESFSVVASAAKALDCSYACGYDAVQPLLKGRLDAIVCSQSEAKLIVAAHKELHIAHTLQERIGITLIFRNQATKQALQPTIEAFVSSDNYRYMREIYIGSEPTAECFPAIDYRPTRVVDGISVWDKTIRSSAEKVGVDWRLMSAMAYHETRFRNSLTSSVGAEGLMQVMPVVAEEFGMPEADLFDPATNTLLAAKLLASSSRALGFGTFPDTIDGITIVVASYHCGITRALEAQRLAERFGRDPKKWEDVKLTMAEMGNPTSYIRSESRMGLFRNHSVTTTYAEGVVALYKGYCEEMN